ncbi:hypothetical protein [Microbacterium imperiale]|uniref:Uncharacterized protein n=1 Tax=Microbacterium imperiale TaxID=33884 RepID=A0A9W6HJI6_9MICO|nr:hypothetical protein [Microbacterium imperiale]MBP2421686.1 4'-phosphopantetheinyl transferase [Microbacterium imperiale]MDS0199212.1 hypothetical protein [Microbacterium imperiale]BFE42029.1 hypothetical protein GCM10017544_29850 [Microbacterium imperiale]GLJ80982.1 hypothetical protein GCM10017586_26650 [Microbacterium imperiale]
MQTVLLDTPAGITARLGWDPAITVHHRRRMIARELVAAHLGCEEKEVLVEREAPRGFGYHTRLIASRKGVDVPLAITTASYRAATVVAVSDPGLPIGIDIRDSNPEPADLVRMRKHSRLFSTGNTLDLIDHWVHVQAVLEADGRGVRVAPEQVRLDAGRHRGWIPDRNMKYTLVDISRDGWLITLAYGTLPGA